VIERDPILLAKEVASLDYLSRGRVLFGIGGGWNAEEMAHHGTDFDARWKVLRERVAAMQEIWTKDEAEYRGKFVNFDKLWSYPKPVQKPHPPILVGGAFPYSARRAVRYGDGWMPQMTEKNPTPLVELIPRFRQMCAEAGRDADKMDISIGGQQPDADAVKRYRDAGVNRVSVSLPSEKADTILPMLDQWVAVMRAVNG
jgi:probable F420-dependent oxidoreductase